MHAFIACFLSFLNKQSPRKPERGNVAQPIADIAMGTISKPGTKTTGILPHSSVDVGTWGRAK
jgi:hypothetical protein